MSKIQSESRTKLVFVDGSQKEAVESFIRYGIAPAYVDDCLNSLEMLAEGLWAFDGRTLLVTHVAEVEGQQVYRVEEFE